MGFFDLGGGGAALAGQFFDDLGVDDRDLAIRNALIKAGLIAISGAGKEDIGSLLPKAALAGAEAFEGNLAGRRDELRRRRAEGREDTRLGNEQERLGMARRAEARAEELHPLAVEGADLDNMAQRLRNDGQQLLNAGLERMQQALESVRPQLGEGHPLLRVAEGAIASQNPEKVGQALYAIEIELARKQFGPEAEAAISSGDTARMMEAANSSNGAFSFDDLQRVSISERNFQRLFEAQQDRGGLSQATIVSQVKQLYLSYREELMKRAEAIRDPSKVLERQSMGLPAYLSPEDAAAAVSKMGDIDRIAREKALADASRNFAFSEDWYRMGGTEALRRALEGDSGVNPGGNDESLVQRLAIAGRAEGRTKEQVRSDLLARGVDEVLADRILAVVYAGE